MGLDILYNIFLLFLGGSSIVFFLNQLFLLSAIFFLVFSVLEYFKIINHYGSVCIDCCESRLSLSKNKKSLQKRM